MLPSDNSTNIFERTWPNCVGLSTPIKSRRTKISTHDEIMKNKIKKIDNDPTLLNEPSVINDEQNVSFFPSHVIFIIKIILFIFIFSLIKDLS